MHAAHDQRPPRPAWRIPAWLALGVFLGAAVVLLWSEHRAHLLNAAFWGLILLCPLAHLLMHGGHGSHGASHGAHARGRRTREEP